jgi:HD-like signal output (HDOD) protein
MSTIDRDVVTASPLPPPLTGDDERVLTALFEDWNVLAEREQNMPPLSPLAFRLLSLDTSADSAAHELAEIIGSDPVLTARVLGVASSARFGAPGKGLMDVPAAVLRLGIDLTSEVCQAQLFGLWLRHGATLVDDDLLRTLWLEYLMTGFCAREIALMLSGDVDPGVAYAGGMLHDVGTLALCWAKPDAMERFVLAGYALGTPLHQRFVVAHSGVGAALLRRWHAPEELAQIAGTHHAGFNPRALASALVVYVADHLHEGILAHEGVEVKPPGAYPLGCFGRATEPVTAALDALGLAEQLDDIILRVGRASHRLEMLASGMPS